MPASAKNCSGRYISGRRFAILVQANTLQICQKEKNLTEMQRIEYMEWSPSKKTLSAWMPVPLW